MLGVGAGESWGEHAPYVSAQRVPDVMQRLALEDHITGDVCFSSLFLLLFVLNDDVLLSLFFGFAKASLCSQNTVGGGAATAAAVCIALRAGAGQLSTRHLRRFVVSCCCCVVLCFVFLCYCLCVHVVAVF